MAIRYTDRPQYTHFGIDKIAKHLMYIQNSQNACVVKLRKENADLQFQFSNFQYSVECQNEVFVMFSRF